MTDDACARGVMLGAMTSPLRQDQNGAWLANSRHGSGIQDVRHIQNILNRGSASVPAKAPFPATVATAPPPAKRVRSAAFFSDDEDRFPEWPGLVPARPASSAAHYVSSTNGYASSRNEIARQAAPGRVASLSASERGIPQGFRVAVENEHEVLVLDDDDNYDNDDNVESSNAARLDGLASFDAIASGAVVLPFQEPPRPVQPPVQRPVQPLVPPLIQPLVQPLAQQPAQQPVQRPHLRVDESGYSKFIHYVPPPDPIQRRPQQPLPECGGAATVGESHMSEQTPRLPVARPIPALSNPPSSPTSYCPKPVPSASPAPHRPKADDKPIGLAASRPVPVLFSPSIRRLPPSSHLSTLPTPPLVLSAPQPPLQLWKQPKRHAHIVPPTATSLRRKPAALSFARFATLPRRPYLQLTHREYVAQNDQELLKKHVPPSHCGLAVIHVDFTPEEVRAVLNTARAVLGDASPRSIKKKKNEKIEPLERQLKRLVHSRVDSIAFLSKKCSVKGRQATDIAAFLADLCSSCGRRAMRLTAPRALTLQRKDRVTHAAAEEASDRSAHIGALLLAREVAGAFTPGRTQQLVNFSNAFRTLREDSLALCKEWTNCAGDVTTLSWTSEDAFVCGTTTHMDERNHQYNRQGNLSLGSVTHGTLRAYADHRVERSSAIVTARNHTAAVAVGAAAAPRNEYDDPWLYTSVVSSDYEATRDLVFTSGFDNAVKLWRVNQVDNTMALVTTWRHKGKVNFVVASHDEPCLVAAAADVASDAIRVYRLPSLETGARNRVTYKSLSYPRIVDLGGKPVVPDEWAYFPAAVRWGLAPDTHHLLLVGYSPRSLTDTSDDERIPEDRRNSGKLCLWDGLTGRRCRILGGTTQNIFEVAWHPTQQCFAAATSPAGQAIEGNVRTQIRIFRPAINPGYIRRVFSEVQVLDCYGDDINELALLPNSFSYIYAAAGCTNGRTYVWDTSQGDKPIHTLVHGPCIEELSGERIPTEDTGIKFVAWGATPDRLYTGSSDGVVKVWNIRANRQAHFVRNLLACPAPVSYGAFSPSKSRLAVGDASGRVFVLAVEDSRTEKDADEDAFLSEADEPSETNDTGQDGQGRNMVTRLSRPKTFRHHPPGIIRHATPPPPPPLSGPLRFGLPETVGTTKSEAEVGSEAHSTSGGLDARSSVLSIHAGDRNDNPSVDTESNAARAHAFLASGQLVLAPSRTVGAVKGPNYAETNLFCRSFHLDGRPENPLLAQYERVQQENRPRASSFGSRQRPLRDVFVADKMLLGGSMDVEASVAHEDDREDVDEDGNEDDDLFVSQSHVDKQAFKACRRLVQQRTLAQHRQNVARDLDVDALAPETRQTLELADRAALLYLDNDIAFGIAYEDEAAMPADL